MFVIHEPKFIVLYSRLTTLHAFCIWSHRSLHRMERSLTQPFPVLCQHNQHYKNKQTMLWDALKWCWAHPMGRRGSGHLNPLCKDSRGHRHQTNQILKPLHAHFEKSQPVGGSENTPEDTFGDFGDIGNTSGALSPAPRWLQEPQNIPERPQTSPNPVPRCLHPAPNVPRCPQPLILVLKCPQIPPWF